MPRNPPHPTSHPQMTKKHPTFDPPQLFAKRGEVTTLMDNRLTCVTGLFKESNLFEKGNMVSDWNYAQRYGANNLKQVRIGVLTFEKGADIRTVQTRLRETLPPDIVVLTREELVRCGIT